MFELEFYLNEICLLFNIIILYSSAPSSTTCLKARSDGAPDNTAVLQAGSPKSNKINAIHGYKLHQEMMSNLTRII